MKTKKIFFILKNYKKNQLGAEKAQYYISQYFIKYTDWKVIVYYKNIEEKEKTKLEQCNNVKLIIAKNNFYLRLPLVLYKEKPDYFFSWRWEYNFLTGLSCKLKKIKSICFTHGFIFKEMKLVNPAISELYLSIYKFFCKITFSKFIDKIFVPSHMLGDYLTKEISQNLKKKIVIQYNGIENENIPDKNYQKIDKRNILFVGGFQKHKGIFNLLEIAKKNRNITFYVYGLTETKYKNEILSKIKKEEFNNIKIRGFSNKIEEIYQKFDIMIFPSELDSFPFSIIEAMGYELIIISTNIGELKYILKDGYNSIIFDGKNFDFNKLDNYNLKEIAQNAQKDFKEKFTLNVYKNILVNLNKLN